MALDPSGNDPRGALDPLGERDVRPLVERPPRGLSGWAIGAGAGVAAILLFVVLDTRRRSLEAPVIAARPGEVIASAAPPALYIPPEPPPVVIVTPTPTPTVAPAPPRPAPAPPPQIIYVPQPAPVQQQQFTPPTPPRNPSGSVLVYDGSSAAAPVREGTASPVQGGGAAGGAGAGGVGNTDRARAATFANRATTVPQGTLIPAVLETAFDSSRPGFARALVQRDVRGFDGTRILIPRGSRLIGDYRGEPGVGQKRAFITWSRLIRPDGVTIAIGSPAADPVGRGGVKASVNSHFFERFSGAILQSALDIGVNFASRQSGSPVIVALPGTVQNATSGIVRQTQIPPTLTVPQGTSISVFVARDLDFTAGERGQ